MVISAIYVVLHKDKTMQTKDTSRALTNIKFIKSEHIDTLELTLTLL